MSENNKSVHELINGYEASPGYELYNFLIQINCFLYVFNDNYKELFNHITKYEKETSSKQKSIEFKEMMPSKTKNRNYLKKFVKYLHNYAASVYSLENHYKNFLFGNNGDGFDKKEWDNFAKIKKEPLRLFIFGLRNYLTHHAIPPVSISVNCNRDQSGKTEFFVFTKGSFKLPKSAITLDYHHKARLGSNYKSKFLNKDEELLRTLYLYVSKEYRDTLSIDLKEVVSNHRKLFHGYINEFNEQLIKKFEAEYYKTKKLHQNIIKIQSRVFKKQGSKKLENTKNKSTRSSTNSTTSHR